MSVMDDQDNAERWPASAVTAAAAEAYAFGRMSFDYFLSDSARQIAAALKKVLDAIVDLRDGELCRHHVTGPDGCFLETDDSSTRPSARATSKCGSVIDGPLARSTKSDASLHRDAETLSRWADAQTPKNHLPKSSRP